MVNLTNYIFDPVDYNYYSKINMNSYACIYSKGDGRLASHACFSGDFHTQSINEHSINCFIPFKNISNSLCMLSLRDIKTFMDILQDYFIFDYEIEEDTQYGEIPGCTIKLSKHKDCKLNITEIKALLTTVRFLYEDTRPYMLKYALDIYANCENFNFMSLLTITEQFFGHNSGHGLTSGPCYLEFTEKQFYNRISHSKERYINIFFSTCNDDHFSTVLNSTKREMVSIFDMQTYEQNYNLIKRKALSYLNN